MNTYLNNTFTSTPDSRQYVQASWFVTKDVNLYQYTYTNGYMLTDYRCDDDTNDIQYLTVVTGTLGECLKYIHKNIRSLNEHI